MQKKEGVLDHVTQAVSKLKDNPSKLVYSTILDIFFFIVFGGVLAFFSEYIMYNVYRISSLTTEFSQNLAITDAPSSVVDMISKAGAMSYFKDAMMYTFLLIFSIYIVYCLFHGSAWYLSTLMSKSKKIKYRRYLKDFSIISIVWFGLFVIYNMALTFLDYFNYVPDGYSRLYFLFPFFIIVSYFAIISYAAIGNRTPFAALKNSFRYGILKARYFFLLYVIIIFAFVIINIILKAVSDINQTAGIIAGIVLFIPAITWTRISIKTLFEYMNKRFK